MKDTEGPAIARALFYNGEIMKYIAALVLVPIATVFVLRSTVHAQPTKSVWDGIYTEEQAKRGGPLYPSSAPRATGRN